VRFTAFGRRREKEEDPLTTLARCIVLMDDARAYRRKDVEEIEKVFSRLKRSRFKEHYDQWVKVRPSVERILDMPVKVKGVKEMIRNLAWLKVVNRIFLIVLVVFAAVLIVPAWRNVLGDRPFGGNAMLYTGIAVALVVLSLNLATFMDYRIRKRIVAYEEATMDEYAPSRDKLKDFVDKMLRTLAREAERAKVDPNSWGMVLYFDDYGHIKVVKQWRPKSVGLWKKSYHHYQVIPKP
jgi:hypothetical protein